MDKDVHMYSISEVANILNVSEKTIRRHINSGKILSKKIGGVHRILKNDLDNFLNIDTPDLKEDYRFKTDENFGINGSVPEGPIEKMV